MDVQSETTIHPDYHHQLVLMLCYIMNLHTHVSKVVTGSLYYLTFFIINIMMRSKLSLFWTKVTVIEFVNIVERSFGMKRELRNALAGMQFVTISVVRVVKLFYLRHKSHLNISKDYSEITSFGAHKPDFRDDLTWSQY